MSDLQNLSYPGQGWIPLGRSFKLRESVLLISITMGKYSEGNCVFPTPNAFVEVLNPNRSQCDFKEVDEVKMRP